MADGARSLRPDIRNPVLQLEEFRELRELLHGTEPIAPAVFRRKLDRALLALARKNRADAQHNWRKNKGMIAAYWKIVGVYVGHIARALR